jgi:hypothetical protein
VFKTFKKTAFVKFNVKKSSISRTLAGSGWQSRHLAYWLGLKAQKQRGLNYTEHKPFGRHYLGVTHTTMSLSSAVKTLTQVKARTGFMAIDVSNYC